VVSAKPERSRGSGRSISGFDLHAALRACSGHLQGYGGHRYAAGLSIAPASIDRFRAALDEFAQGFPAAVFEPTLHIDAVADIDSVNSDLLRVLERFEPFGPDNPTPVFASLAVEVVGYPRRIGTDHLKLRVRGKSQVHEAVAWGRSRDLLHLAGGGSRLDICYTVDRRIYAGRETMQLTLRDLRAAEPVPGQ
jgi:single-stranded-DNA-specific exonuclease